MLSLFLLNFHLAAIIFGIANASRTPSRVPTVLPSLFSSSLPTLNQTSFPSSKPSISPSLATFTEEVKVITPGTCDAVCGATCTDCQSIKTSSLGRCCGYYYDPNPSFVSTQNGNVGIVADSNGNVYVVGTYNDDIWLGKYSKEGDKVFSVIIDSVDHREETASDVVFDEKSQQLYIIGTTKGYFAGFNNDWSIANGLLLKFSLNGTQLQCFQFTPDASNTWFENFRYEISLTFSGIVICKSGELFLSGSESYPVSSNSLYRESFIRKLHANGTMIFHLNFNNITVNAVATDDSDNVYLTGVYLDSRFSPNSPYLVFSKFDSNGSHQFSVKFMNPSTGASLSIDSAKGFAFITGTVTVNPDSILNALFKYSLFDGSLVAQWTENEETLKWFSIIRGNEGSLLVAAALTGCPHKTTYFRDPHTNESYIYSVGSTCSSCSLDLTIFLSPRKYSNSIAIDAVSESLLNSEILIRSDYGSNELIALAVDGKTKTAFLLLSNGLRGNNANIILSQCSMDRFDTWFVNQCSTLTVIGNLTNFFSYGEKIIFDELSHALYFLVNTEKSPGYYRGILFKYVIAGSQLFSVQFPSFAEDFALDSLGRVVVLDSSPGVRKYYQDGSLAFYQQISNYATVLAVDTKDNIIVGGCRAPNYFVLNSFGEFLFSLTLFRDACVEWISIDRQSSLVYLITYSGIGDSPLVWVLSPPGNVLKTWTVSGYGYGFSILEVDFNGTILHLPFDPRFTAVVDQDNVRDYYWPHNQQIVRFSTEQRPLVTIQNIRLQHEPATSFVPNLLYGSTQFLINEIRIDEHSYEKGEAIVADSKKNIFLLSNFLGRNSTGSTKDVWIGLITKYSNDGTRAFRKAIPYSGTGLVIHERSKSVYVTGRSWDRIVFYKFTYSGVEVFNHTFAGYDYSRVAIDNDGNVYLLLDRFGSYVLNKISPDGNTLWEVNSRGHSELSFSGIATDQRKNVFITGFANGYGNERLYLRKYDSSGVLLFYTTIQVNITNLSYYPRTVTIFAQDHENAVYISGGIYAGYLEYKYGLPYESSFILRCSMGNGSVLESRLRHRGYNTGHFFAPAGITRVVVDSKSNLYSSFGYSFEDAGDMYRLDDISNYNALAIHETRKEVAIYATGYTIKRNKKDNQAEGIEVIITLTSSVKPIPWYLSDPVAFTVVLAIIGFGVVLGLIWLVFGRFREYTQTLFKNHWVCRFYYCGLGILEVADIISDALWAVSLVKLAEYYDYRINPMFWSIYYSSFVFLSVSGLLLIGKIKCQLLSIFNASDRSHEYVKLHCFLLNVYYSWSVSNEKILEFHETAVEKENSNVFDDLLGLNRENLWTREFPQPIPLLLLMNLEDENGKKLNTVWDFFIIPLNLLFSYQYFRKFSYLSIFPVSVSLPGVCGLWLYFPTLFFLNIVENSNHLVTVRLLEDIPQLILQALFLRYVQATSLNAFSAFSIVCSGLLLLKFLVETVLAVGKETEEKKREEVRVRYNLTNVQWYHMFYLTFISPILISVLIPFYLVFWILKFFANLPLSLISPMYNSKVVPSQETSEKKNDEEANDVLNGVEMCEIYQNEAVE
jgi:hypothetical protein